MTMQTKSCLVPAFALAVALAAQASDIKLVPPAKTGGMPVVQAIAERKTARAFSERELPAETLSTLLWIANGISRPDGRRTIPTGHNVQDLDVYVILRSGAYRYDEKAHALVLMNAGDFQAIAGKQLFSQKAPVNLFYVQDTARAKKVDAMSQMRFGGIHTGAAMQNVYLFCTSAGLATCAREQNDYAALAKVFKLSPTQRIVLGQSVGYPVDAFSTATSKTKESK